jgi:isoleucyl-tRNA synthetase
MAGMALARRIASLGLGARGSVNIKVRQPLAAALIYAGDGASLPAELAEIVADELNVKRLEFVAKEGRLVSYRLAADGRLLGPRLGGRFPQARAALAALDPAATVRRLREGLPVELALGDETVELAAEEVIIHTEPAEGLAVAADRGLTVAIDAVITPELEAEGLVRDLVRQVQTQRKEADYDLDQRIAVGLFGLSDALTAAVEAFRDYLCGETLCERLLLADDGAPWDSRQEVKLGGGVTVAVRRIAG